jgi:putative acetyltransferase
VSERADSGVVIRAESPGDVGSVQAVVAAAFVNQPVVADLVAALRESSAWRPGLSFVAMRRSHVVGHVLATRGWLDAPRRLLDVLVLSPLSVAPGDQRHGIGGQLVRHLLAVAATRPEPLVFLEGDPAYYSRFGFQPASALGMRRPSERIPEPAFQLYRLPAYEPWMSGTLVYADPFWELDCVGLRPDDG